MGKLRVYQLARELNRDNSQVIRELQHMGVPVTSHSNTVEDRLAEQLRKRLGVLVIEEEPKTVPLPPVVQPEEVKIEAKVEPAKVEPVKEVKPEPKVEEKIPEPVAQAPAPHKVEPRITPPPEARVAAPVEQKPPAPAPPPKVEPVHEERKTMQQLAQERLRQQIPLGRPAAPTARRPIGRDVGRGPRPPFTDSQRPSRPQFQARGTTAPAREDRGVRSWPQAPVGPPPTEPGRRTPEERHERERIDRFQRLERQVPKKIEAPPILRPQPRPAPPREFRKITLTEGLTVKDIAEKLDVRTKDLIKKLMDRGVFATINQTLENEVVKEICKEFNAEADFLTFEESVMLHAVEVSSPEKMVVRPPVVTIMGHVDHGKTSLLDAIRKTKITEQEAGGITQHIGAYQVEAKGRKITFLDTPGHEAFTMMRARGARVTDIVVLVVAADDGVMPQTIESIAHTKAAKVPIVVAINKIDKPGANSERVKRGLSEHGLLAEDWGGDTVMVEVSAKQHTNLELLLEMILLVADIQNLKGDPSLPAMGTVLEAKVDRGRGNVATVLVQNGTLRVGDNFIAGAVYGKVRAMFDELANSAKEAAPSTPVEVLGLQGLPMAGDAFQAITDATKARQIGTYRQEKIRETSLAKSARLTLDQLHKQLAEGEIKEVPLILKTDVQGSVEALAEMLNKLSTEKVKVRIIHGGVGAITETDVLLAAASNAIVIGFSVRPERKAADLAVREEVDIRLHTIIYNVTDEIKRAMAGVLEPVTKETHLGTAEVRNTFRIPKVGIVAGCYITDGKITRNAEVRLLRDNVVVYEGKVSSLKRFKDDASEVRVGYECGIGLGNFNDVKIGDTIEAFVTEKVTADVGA